MNNTLIFTLRENLDNLIKKDFLNDKFIVLFGMNTPGDEVINYLARKGFGVNAVIDNNVLNKGKKLAGVSVYLPGELLSEVREDAVILICSRYFSEMKKQLEEMGYNSEKQIFQVLDMGAGTTYSIEEKYFEENKNGMISAYDTLKRFRDMYGSDVRLILAPVKANGDVYIISSMFTDYVAKRNYENVRLVVIGMACKKIAGMFGIDDVIAVTQEEMDNLVRVSRFVGREATGVEVVQPYYMYTSIFAGLEGYKKLNFNDFFGYGYLLKDEDREMNLPINSMSEEEIEKLAKSLSIEKGKTFILAPYANSLPQVEWGFWIKLVEELKKMGYKVFTNSASDDEEQVPGSEKIFFQIKDTVKLLEYAGGFIAMRNGLCEVASSAKCKQIIVYPDKAGGFAKIIDVYGIKAMGLSDDVIEIEDSEELLDKVLEVVR